MLLLRAGVPNPWAAAHYQAMAYSESGHMQMCAEPNLQKSSCTCMCVHAGPATRADQTVCMSTSPPLARPGSPLPLQLGRQAAKFGDH